MPRIEVPIADTMPRDQSELVKVFYGTNRGRTVAGNDKHDVAVAVLTTAGGGMLAMLFCLIGSFAAAIVSMLYWRYWRWACPHRLAIKRP